VTSAFYRLEWSYLGELPIDSGPFKYGDEAHCGFLIRFLDTPPGPGHCASLCVNVITSAKAAQLGLGPEGRRAYLVANSMTQEAFCRRVTEDVSQALEQLPRLQALAQLNESYVWEFLDYCDEFRVDALRAQDLVVLVEEAFAGVTRGDGISLHEAIAMDDYATPETRAAARAQDHDTDWHDVPNNVLSAHCEVFSYLDPAGYRYYLPAAMLLCLSAETRARSTTPQRTYWSLLPCVAPRDFGKGLGKDFDNEAFISRCGFTHAQVCAIYRFLCFMATEGNEGVDEEQLPAMRKWRECASGRTGSGSEK
jgi:hypothetical protein